MSRARNVNVDVNVGIDEEVPMNWALDWGDVRASRVLVQRVARFDTSSKNTTSVGSSQEHSKCLFHAYLYARSSLLPKVL